MESVYKQLGPAIPSLMRDMAVYFVQFRPYRRSTLYCRLVTDLDRTGILPRTLFSTLNYECLLEYSLTEQGHRLNYFHTALPGQVPVLKLHGSCNMFPHKIEASPGILYGTGVIWEADIRALPDPNEVIRHCLVETALAPVMCLYMRGKPVGVSPGAIRQIQGKWTDALASASTIVCIGVKPVSEDEHIWQPLTSAPANLYFIGDEGPFQQWCQSRNGPAMYLGERFNEAYPELLRRLVAHETD